MPCSACIEGAAGLNLSVFWLNHSKLESQISSYMDCIDVSKETKLKVRKVISSRKRQEQQKKLIEANMLTMKRLPMSIQAEIKQDYYKRIIKRSKFLQQFSQEFLQNLHSIIEEKVFQQED